MCPGNPHASYYVEIDRRAQRPQETAGPEVSMNRLAHIAASMAAFCLCLVGPLAQVVRAQGPSGPAPVRTTEARSLDLERSVRLTGSVESRRSSLVASEVEGLVQQLAAREGDRVKPNTTASTIQMTIWEPM